MSSINNVVLSGRLTKNVEVRMSKNNKKFEGVPTVAQQ